MTFSWEVSLGTVVATLTLLGAFLAAHISNRERFARLETKVNAMWRRWVHDRSGFDDNDTH